MITNLGPSQQNTYRAFAAGDRESQVGGGFGGGGTCFDNDMWLLRSEGLDYATGQPTNPGHDDNVSIVEFNCQTNTFPPTYTFSTTPTSTSEHVINMATATSQDLDVADIDGDDCGCVGIERREPSQCDLRNVKRFRSWSAHK